MVLCCCRSYFSVNFETLTQALLNVSIVNFNTKLVYVISTTIYTHNTHSVIFENHIFTKYAKHMKYEEKSARNCYKSASILRSVGEFYLILAFLSLRILSSHLNRNNTRLKTY